MAYQSKKTRLEAGLRPVRLGGKGVSDARAEKAVRARMTALEWYAKRQALVDTDEDPQQNDLRLYAGEALARLHNAAYRRQRVTGRYEATARSGGAGQGEMLHVLNEDARRAYREKIEALPNRVRSVLHLCVIEDQFVGRSRMERLRCGLDKLVEMDQAKKVIQKDTKCVDDRASV